MPGLIYQINTSPGGVPKLPQESADITPDGLIGDKHRNRRYHGGPLRAICLYSWELIQSLQAEGHPIYSGAIGENLTLTGLDWSQLVPGVHLYLGATVILEITSYTVPCENIADSFAAGNIGRVSQKRHPGWSRVYAQVVEPGRIQVGDSVQLVVE